MTSDETNTKNTEGQDNVIEDEEEDTEAAAAEEEEEQEQEQVEEDDEEGLDEMDPDKELLEGYHDCNCRFYPNLFDDFSGAFYGGCVIDEDEPAPTGYLCHCSMPFFFTCKGDPVEFVSDGEVGCSGGYGEDCCDPSGNCGGYFQKKEDDKATN